MEGDVADETQGDDRHAATDRPLSDAGRHQRQKNRNASAERRPSNVLNEQIWFLPWSRDQSSLGFNLRNSG